LYDSENRAEESEGRTDAIRAVYHAFGRKENDEAVEFAVSKTRGIGITKFLDACRRIEKYEEFPKNLSRELIAIAGEESPAISGCPGCCVYLNGEPQIFEGERIPFVPGLRKYYRNDTDDIYERIGHTVPCSCAAGRRILAEIRKAGPIVRAR
jgi:hypothetical protein